MGNKLASASAPLKDIPGVGGPIEDPIDREKNRTYHDVELEIPEFEVKSKINPLPLMWSWVYYSFTGPAHLAHKFFDSISIQQPRRYYHRKLRRVPEIWECPVDDSICVYEAEKQFDRDRKIDQEILHILHNRVRSCIDKNKANHSVACAKILELERQTENAWRTKYGDIGQHINARKVLNKQKNRFIETRYLAAKNGEKVNTDEDS